MMKVFLYVVVFLMFCDIAYATPIESLVQSIVMTVLSLLGLFTAEGYFGTKINLFIPFGVIYGLYLFYHAYILVQFFKAGEKERKEWSKTEGGTLVFFYIPPILAIVSLLIYRGL